MKSNDSQRGEFRCITTWIDRLLRISLRQRNTVGRTRAGKYHVPASESGASLEQFDGATNIRCRSSTQRVFCIWKCLTRGETRGARSGCTYRDPVPKIHHAIASKAKAYVVRLVPPSTAELPHRFDAGRKQLSIGACRRGLCSLYSRIHRSESTCNSSIERYTFLRNATR
jgi:hypothetical protein